MKRFLALSLSVCCLTLQAQNIPMPKPGPAPTVNIGKPQTFELGNGLKVLVVENHKLPRVSFNLTLDNPPYAEANKKGVSDLMGSLLGSGFENTTKDAYNEEVDFLGTSINFSSDGAYASGLSKYSQRILELMAQGALHTTFNQVEFDKEKAKMLEGLKAGEKDVSTIARRAENVLCYGKNHPFGEYVSENSLKSITLDDVILNYNTYFVPENAYLVVIGDVKWDEIKTQVEALFGPWLKAAAPNLSYTDPKDVQYTQINFVDVPNAVQSEISIMNLSKLKMTDADYFPVMLTNYILGGSNGHLMDNIREKHGWTYDAGSNIGAQKYIGRFIAYAQVRNAVTDSAVVEMLNEVKRMRTEKVSDKELKEAKASFIGQFVMQTEKPQAIAGYALRTRTQSLPEDFYENYIRNINAVTAEDIQRVANLYIKPDKARIVIAGKGEEIIPGLEKLKIPMFYFDKWGGNTTKPEYKRIVPAEVTAQSVIENYLKNIGGQKAVSEVKTLMSVASGTIQGAPVELTSKSTSSGKMMREMKAMGMSMMKQVVNEKSGYIIQQGQRKDLTPDEFKEYQQVARPFNELELLTKPGVVLQGLESFNDTDAYVIKDGKNLKYFDAKTGLKIAEALTLNVGGKEITQTISFGDYRDVKGIKFPFETRINLGIEILLVTTEVKINEGVSDEDFK